MAKKKKRSNKIIYILMAVLVGLIVLVVLLKGSSKKETTVVVETPQIRTIVEKISASGMVQPVTEVKLSPDVAGEIIALMVEESDSVTMGQLLVKIRPDNYISFVQRAEASLNQTKANLLSSKSNLARSEATYKRSQKSFERSKILEKEGVISDSDFELAEQNYIIAQNDFKSAEAAVQASEYVVKSSRASLEDAKENLRKTAVLSPISGIVSKLDVKKGERVVGTSQFSGTEMLRIADLNNMEVRVDVNENDIIRIAVSDTAIIDVDAYTHLEKKFKGVVTKIAHTAKAKASADAVTEFEVKIKILASSYADLVDEGNQHPFKPGMTASVDIITNTKADIITVPLAAVTVRKESELDKNGEGEGDDSGERSDSNQASSDDDNAKDEKKIEVIFINDNGVAKVVKVKTGISDYENIEIVSELNDSTKVITGPFIAVSKRLKDGDLVRVNEKKEKNKEKED